MKFAITLILFTAGLLIVSVLRAQNKPVPGAVRRADMLNAFRIVEAWDGETRGAAGERGPWQLTEQLWRQHSTKPHYWADFRTAEERKETTRVLNAHYDWVVGQVHEIGMTETPFSIALVWCAGATAVRRCEVSSRKIGHVERVCNVYETLK